MNAPATLDDLHAARSKLLAKESALWEQRAKLEGLERTAEKAESDLKNVRGATSAELKNWTANACQGPMPGIDSMKLGRLQDAAMRARNAVELAGGAMGAVERQAHELGEELYANRLALEMQLLARWRFGSRAWPFASAK